MAATLDDVVTELQNLRAAIENLEIGGGGGSGGSEGAAGAGPSGKKSKAGGALSSFKGYLAAAEAGLGAGVDIAERTGILAGIRTKNLGGSNAAAAGSVAARATASASQTTLGRAFLANTGQNADADDAARGGVANFAAQAALGGSKLSRAQISEGLSRQKKVAQIRQASTNRVANIQSEDGRTDRAVALGKDGANFAKAAAGAAKLAANLDVLNGLLGGLPGLLAGSR